MLLFPTTHHPISVRGLCMCVYSCVTSCVSLKWSTVPCLVSANGTWARPQCRAKASRVSIYFHQLTVTLHCTKKRHVPQCGCLLSWDPKWQLHAEQSGKSQKSCQLPAGTVWLTFRVIYNCSTTDRYNRSKHFYAQCIFIVWCILYIKIKIECK